MTLASIYITHHDGVRRRHQLVLTPLLVRLYKAVFGVRAKRADEVSPRQLTQSRRKLFALARSCEEITPSLSAELRHLASRT
jgi:hypothetical protein